MSKKILSLLLVLTLLVTVSVFAVEATDPENSEVVYSNPTKEAFDAAVLAAGEEAATLDFYCEACDKVVTWTKNTSTAIPNKKGAGGHTYIPSGSKAVGQQIVGVSSSGEYAKTVTEENGDRSTTFCLYLNGDGFGTLTKLGVLGVEGVCPQVRGFFFAAGAERKSEAEDKQQG